MWKDLSMYDKNKIIEMAVSQGVINLNTISSLYDQQNLEFGSTNNQVLDNRVKPIIADNGGTLNIGDPKSFNPNKKRYQKLIHINLQPTHMNEQEEDKYAQARDWRVEQLVNAGMSYESAEDAEPYDSYNYPTISDQIKAMARKQVDFFGNNYRHKKD